MRKLGMIGGMSWASTRRYYELINRDIQKASDKRTSAPLLLESLDFNCVYRLRSDEEWQRATDILADSANRLKVAGAAAIIICANSMHKIYRELDIRVDLPIIHIAETVGAKMQADGVKTASLIGTHNVMTEGFYRRRLVSYGVDLLPPDMAVVEQVDNLIYDELMQGRATRDAERLLKTVITNQSRDGAEAIVLACTELEMVVDIDANILPIYDSTTIHAQAAADWILGKDPGQDTG